MFAHNKENVAFHWINYITALENLKYFAAAYFNISFLGPNILPINPHAASVDIRTVSGLSLADLKFILKI